MQYTAICKNLIGLKPKRIAMMNRTGMWSIQNIDEMRKFCNVHLVTDADTDHNCTKIDSTDKWSINPDASFYCICTNETVNGIEIDWEDFPFDKVPKDIPIIADMSSNIGTNIIPWDKLGMVYAGTQKNLGTAGCTVMIIREDLFGHAEPDCPILCDWDLHEKSPDTYYNTPAIMPMYITGLNCAYMNQNGGLDKYIDLANQRGTMLWNFIDGSNGYYKTKLTEKIWRSRINVIFRIQGGNTKLEE
jgi:phosphoserine aminotransferase